MQNIAIKLFWVCFFLCSSLSIRASDPQQDNDPQNNPGQYQLDKDLVYKKLYETPRYHLKQRNNTQVRRVVIGSYV